MVVAAVVSIARDMVVNDVVIVRVVGLVAITVTTSMTITSAPTTATIVDDAAILAAIPSVAATVVSTHAHRCSESISGTCVARAHTA